MLPHETKKEWFKNAYPLGKILYCLGGIRLYKKGASSNKWHYGAKFRLVNPVTWIFLIFALFVGGFNKETYKELKDDTVWF